MKIRVKMMWERLKTTKLVLSEITFTILRKEKRYLEWNA